jgi:cytidine deaminase
MSGALRRLPIEPGDLELVEVASALLRERMSPLRHHVAAAIRTSSGEIVTGLHVGSRRVNVCAEQVALGAALAAGHSRFVACAAVIAMAEGDEPVVTSPCGVCREVLGFYEPDMTVLVDDGGEVVKTYVADLLPAPWLLPGEGTHPPTEATEADNRKRDG